MSTCPIKYTCPAIDNAISGLEEAKKNIDQAYVEIDELLGRHGILEELREANDGLRNWGYGLESQIEGLNAEINVLENEIEDLLREREELLSQISYLENKHE